MKYSAAAQQHGTVTFEGVEYALCQQAYIGNYGTNGAVRYYAKAIDVEANEYKVTWETIEYENDHVSEDESDACDWDNPYSVSPL